MRRSSLYLRRHWAHFFPALRTLHRTTFACQAANLHALKERLWQWVREPLPHDAHLAIVDSLALPVGQFTRAPRCRLFKGEDTYGHDHLTHQLFYGFRVHAHVCWLGVICQIKLTPGNGQEPEAAIELTAGTQGALPQGPQLLVAARPGRASRSRRMLGRAVSLA
jgi:hypothetical protein